MERLSISKRSKRNHQEISDEQNDDTSKRRLSKSKEIKRKKINTSNLNSKNGNTKIIEQSHNDNQKSLIKNNKMKKISENILCYLLSFFDIYEYFDLIKVNKRIKNNLTSRNELFEIYLYLKKSKIFKNRFSSLYDCPKFRLKTELSSFYDYLRNFICCCLNNKLSEREIDCLLSNYIISEFKPRELHLEDEDDTIYNTKMICIHPKSKLNELQCKLSDSNNLKFFEHLSEIIKKSSSLQNLSLSNFSFNSQTLEIFKSALENNKNIEKLLIKFKIQIFSESEMDRYYEFFQSLIDIFNSNKSIKDLTFHYLEIRGPISLIISYFIKSNKSIQTFNLHSPFMREITCKSLFNDSLRLNNSLKSITLSGLNLNKNLLQSLADDLCNHTVLNSRNQLYATLQNLSLNRCGIKDLLEIIRILKYNTNIVKINLSENQIDVNYIEPLCDLLILNKPKVTLKFLDLSKNNLNDVGLKLILEAMKSNVSIKYLNISYNRGFLSLEDFKSLLSINTSLRELNVLGIYKEKQTQANIEKILLSRNILKINENI